jgi:hypothetical protein
MEIRRLRMDADGLNNAAIDQGMNRKNDEAIQLAAIDWILSTA